MKTISGKVICSRPLSLDVASKFLAKFVSAETEASQSNKAFLRRTSFAFNELNHQIKHLRPSKPDLKRKNQHRAVENDAVELKYDAGSGCIVNKDKKKKKRGGEEESAEVKKEIGQLDKHGGSKKKRIKSKKC